GRGIRIRGGTARAYYVGIESAAPAVPGYPAPLRAACLAPFGMEEGSSLEIPGLEVGAVVGEKSSFRFFASSARREDQPGTVVEDVSELQELPAIEAELPAREGSAGEVLPVGLRASVTEVGTLALPQGALSLPWEERALPATGGGRRAGAYGDRTDPAPAVGIFARDQGARVPGRHVASAKSWLCHPSVDRTARILPWGAPPEVGRLSPVEASARILAHLRSAWDSAHPQAPLAEQDLVVTVPASFDEGARALTLRAAQ